MILDPGSFAEDETSMLPQINRYLSDFSPQPMLALEGPSHKVRHLNSAFCKLVGKSRAELKGNPFAEAVPEGDQNGCLALLDRVFNTGNSEILTEQEHLNSGYWTYTAWAIPGADHRSIGVMMQITDATDMANFRKRAADINQALVVSAIKQHELAETAERLNLELLAATQYKNQFLATMSHEIRTPLNAILGFSELLSLEELSSQDRRDYEARIRRNGQLLLQLIGDILDLSKIEAGKLDIEKIEVNLPELLADISVVLQHLAEVKSIAFSMKEIDLLPAIILCDPTRLKQILMNVIGNAVKFTSKGAVDVAIKVDDSKQCLRIMVKDTGAGMSAEQASKIFKPFTQGDASTTRKFGGSGLGLDLARRLAKALGGDVVVVKTIPGEGSVFEITIAMEQPQWRKIRSESLNVANDLSQRLEGLNILLADDALDNQFLISKFLTSAGAGVDVANDGEQAVAMGSTGDYDIILMDIHMPRLDGYKATTKLRDLGCQSFIVALTAHAMLGEDQRCRLAGCDFYLSKPVGRLHLIEVLSDLVKEPLTGWNRQNKSMKSEFGDLHDSITP